MVEQKQSGVFLPHFVLSRLLLQPQVLQTFASVAHSPSWLPRCSASAGRHGVRHMTASQASPNLHAPCNPHTLASFPPSLNSRIPGGPAWAALTSRASQGLVHPWTSRGALWVDHAASVERSQQHLTKGLDSSVARLQPLAQTIVEMNKPTQRPMRDERQARIWQVERGKAWQWGDSHSPTLSPLGRI